VSPTVGVPALRLAGVDAGYGSRAALVRVDLAVRPGEFLALTGPNGSGKSTLLRVALGLVEPSRGSAELFGTPLAALSVRERAFRVAWVPQAEPLREEVPLDRYVLYGRYAAHGTFGRENDDDRRLATEAIAEVGLADRAHDSLLALSGGERQRAVLARALCQQAPLLLLDEPTTHLDIGHQLDLLDRVRRLVRERGITVVAALHDLNLAARFADRIVVLSRGRCVADGPPGRVLSSELLARVWGIDAELRQDAGSGLPYLLPRLAPPAPPGTAPGPRVHVVAGGGSGASLVRHLVDAGYDVSVGVVPLFDTDATVAQELGVPAALELPFAPIGEEALRRFDALVDGARAVVVAPFPVGPSNVANLTRLGGRAGGPPVLLLPQPPNVRWDYADGAGEAARDALRARGAIEVAGEDEAIAWLDAQLRRRGGAAPSGEGDDLERGGPGRVEEAEELGGVPVEHDHRR
jgi:iron complex transport system ATP-binding protein